jgi:hypothetical protein
MCPDLGKEIRPVFDGYQVLKDEYRTRQVIYSSKRAETDSLLA